MKYGVMINGQLLVHKQRKDGDIPIIKTDAPAVTDGYRNIYRWEETESTIVQVWQTIEDAEAHYEETDIPDSEALSLITGGTI